MDNAITTTHSGGGILARYGSAQEIALFTQRAAAIFQIPAEELSRPDVQAALTKATQYCLRYGYLPGIHVHMLPFNQTVERPNPQNPQNKIKEKIKTYTPDMGEKAWKDSADRIAQAQRFAYVVETQAMTPDEVKAATATIPEQDYHPNDAGCRARVLRSDHAQLYQTMGRRYDPEWVMGFWRQKKDRWGNPDTIPAGRTPADVARRRAEKAARMAVFHLVPLDEYEEAQRFRRLSAYVEDETAIDPPPTPVGTLSTTEHWERDEEGGLWAAERPRLVAEEKARMDDEPEPTIKTLDDVSSMDWEDEEGARPAPVAPGAGPRINDTGATCPDCKAPAGKMHATKCGAA